jgi:molybdopterin-guanine dinucleotide biosynthesis protein A
MISNISGVILAGGASKRLNGITKSNILVGGQSIISRIIDTISIVFDEIVIVTNNPDEFKEFNHLKIVGDHILKAGPIGGIHAALNTSDKEALFVIAGDMPLIRKDFIIRQIDYYNAHNYDVLIPRIKSNIEPLHAIYSCSVRKSLEKYLEDDHNKAVRDFFNLVNVGYMQFDESVETKNAFININAPSDILVVEEILGIS